MEYIDRINTQAKEDGGKLHDFSVQITNNEKPWGGITYMIGYLEQDVISKLRLVATMNKYRAKT